MKSFAITLTLTQKLVAGYALMLFFTLAAVIFAVSGLYSLNWTAKDIAANDLAFLTSATRLRETLQAQERFAGRYLILNSPEFREMFSRKDVEFTATLLEMEKTRDRQQLAPLTGAYKDYKTRTEALLASGKGDPRASRRAADQVSAAIDSIYNERRKILQDKLEESDRRENATVRWTLILSFTGFVFAMGIAAFFTHHISMAIRKLKRATNRIAEGDFDFDPRIPAGDEIGDLAQDFSKMAKKLKELEQISLDASPLTRLPGNIAIERVLNRLLQENEPFAVCYGDLDNFKAYNDRYGYIKASEVIRLTGELIDRAVHIHGDEESFVGHVGGDDFIMITKTDQASRLCEAVIGEFDETIVNHYTPEDLARGAIEGVDRYGVKRSFPIMTISIAVLFCKKGEYDSAVDIAKTAASIKEHLKGSPGSNYFINRRRHSR